MKNLQYVVYSVNTGVEIPYFLFANLVLHNCSPENNEYFPLTEICGIGYFYDDTTSSCQECPVHHYQDERGQSSCKECPDNKKTSSTGTNTVDKCYGGLYTVIQAPRL